MRAGAEAAGQAPPDLGDDYRVSAPFRVSLVLPARLAPRSPGLPVRIWRGRVAPWVVLGERGGSGHREAVGPQGGVWAPGFSAHYL